MHTENQIKRRSEQQDGQTPSCWRQWGSHWTRKRLVTSEPLTPAFVSHGFQTSPKQASPHVYYEENSN